jgi:hypothetical protein
MTSSTGVWQHITTFKQSAAANILTLRLRQLSWFTVGTEQSALQVSGTVAMAPCWAGCSMNTAQTREGAAAAAAAPSLQTLPVMLSVLLQRHLTLLTAAHCPSPYLLHTGLDPPPRPD